ncbi:hypothetical protein ABE137_12590 [Brevibacillus laterosporus]|uniref:transcriptional regulator n=1 Tax=Brevibacillus phage Sundance TaxID=1691958 RepID=UPI0006BE1760|nr:transcriptional regulator [Brevibacillus phage Sundance]ALA47825.1 hypothetical protein SUNDANCE_9 [Brevibacillus phage Sundance]
MNKAVLINWLRIEDSVNIQIPNEIFKDFDKADFKSFQHKCFGYAYYYLATYLYRNTLFGNSDIEKYSQQKIVELFVSNNTIVSYITKKNGLLDSIRYTKTTNNYPTSFYVNNGLLEFSYVNDLKERIPDYTVKHSPRFFVKEPVKALVRFDNEDFTGTFYSFQNTHRIDIKTFIDIISDKQLGHVGLYIYGYLSMMCDKFPLGYQISNQRFGEIIGCSDRTITKYTTQLEKEGLIKSERKLLGYKLLEKIYRVT